jgi:hypothetical protein
MPLSGESQFTEAAMYVPIFGRYAGEYVAECAKSRCGDMTFKCAGTDADILSIISAIFSNYCTLKLS